MKCRHNVCNIKYSEENWKFWFYQRKKWCGCTQGVFVGKAERSQQVVVSFCTGWKFMQMKMPSFWFNVVEEKNVRNINLRKRLNYELNGSFKNKNEIIYAFQTLTFSLSVILNLKRKKIANLLWTWKIILDLFLNPFTNFFFFSLHQPKKTLFFFLLILFISRRFRLIATAMLCVPLQIDAFIIFLFSSNTKTTDNLTFVWRNVLCVL